MIQGGRSQWICFLLFLLFCFAFFVFTFKSVLGKCVLWPHKSWKCCFNKISYISLLQSFSLSKESCYGNLLGHGPCRADTFCILQCGRLQKMTADSSHHCMFALFAQQLCSSYHKRDEVKFSILWICTWPCNLLWLIEY